MEEEERRLFEARGESDGIHCWTVSSNESYKRLGVVFSWSRVNRSRLKGRFIILACCSSLLSSNLLLAISSQADYHLRPFTRPSELILTPLALLIYPSLWIPTSKQSAPYALSLSPETLFELTIPLSELPRNVWQNFRVQTLRLPHLASHQVLHPQEVCQPGEEELVELVEAVRINRRKWRKRRNRGGRSCHRF